MYKYIIFDVDDTLLNFESAFHEAQKNVAIKLGVELSKGYIELDEKAGWRAWKECGLDNTESEDVQRNYHTYYYQYLRNHYLYLLQELGLDICVDELLDEYVIRDLQCDPKECLMVGDSITNDILGAKAVGMDVCFYNIKGRDVPKDLGIDYEISSIQELVKIFTT